VENIMHHASDYGLSINGQLPGGSWGTMIIETTDNRLYAVRETGDANLAHVWYGIPMKRGPGGTFAPRGKGKIELVRKAGCRILANPMPGAV
jgi:hypothetical protein